MDRLIEWFWCKIFGHAYLLDEVDQNPIVYCTCCERIKLIK